MRLRDSQAKALSSIPVYAKPKTINTDKNPTYGKAISELKLAEKCPPDLEHDKLNTSITR